MVRVLKLVVELVQVVQTAELVLQKLELVGVMVKV